MTMQVLDTPEQIQAYRLLSLRAALKLEVLGMKRRGRSVYSIVKAMGFHGKSKVAVLDSYEAYLRDAGILR